VTPLSGPVLTAAQMLAAERDSGVPLSELMERAGGALAEAVWRFGNGAPTLVLCGPGNNGGDGYVAARLLAARGLDVRVAALDGPKTGLAKAARASWVGDVETLADARPAPVLVDALFGTGLTRNMEEDYGGPLRALGAKAQRVIAADVPSGIGSDDGSVIGAPGADITIAFAAAKPGHLLQPAAALCGRVLVADIGIAVHSDVMVLAKPDLAPPGPTDHKYTRGMVAVVPGVMRGAATLSVTAAAHLAGYAILCGEGDAPAAVVRRPFEATLSDPKLGALLIGPGLHETPENAIRVAAALASRVPIVLDAGAIAMVSSAGLRRDAPTVITPHEGEFARAFPALTGSKIERARAAAIETGATVVLKGSDTVIASPDGRVALCPAASAWLATAGTGDVLAGIVVAMLGRGLGAHAAACAAVWLQGEAARRAGPGLIADDLPRHLATSQ